MKSTLIALFALLVVYLAVGWMKLAALGVATIVILWKIRSEKDAEKCRNSLKCTQEELGKTRQQVQQLAAETECRCEQIGYERLASLFKADGSLVSQWKIVGINKVLKSSAYESDKINEDQEPLKQREEVLDFLPPPPSKRPATEADYQPALVLARRHNHDKFTVVVVRYADIAKFSDRNEVLARIDSYPLETKKGWGFDIPKSERGTGALSLALNYVLALAKAEQVPILEAKLTSIWDEAHRIRLGNFYKRKYGFTYLPDSGNPSGNGYITKILT